MIQAKIKLETLYSEMLNHLVSDDEWMYTSELSNYLVKIKEIIDSLENSDE